MLDRSLRVTVNFHPDREPAGEPLLDRMQRDGRYRSQFETGTSNGGLTACQGGRRWDWEHRVFGGVYDDAPAGERPKYGSLNHRRRSVGGSLRFGSAHLRLAEGVLDRTTFCFPDSVFEPTRFGTRNRFDLFRLVDELDAVGRTEESEWAAGGLLDDSVEAHVHGVISLTDDVEAIVLHPCYRGTDVAMSATRLGVPLNGTKGAFCSSPSWSGTRCSEVRAPSASDVLWLWKGASTPWWSATRCEAAERNPRLSRSSGMWVARFGYPAP